MSDTPLHDAAKSGDMDRARELLEHGRYDVNCMDERSRTPLHCACRYGKVDMVKMLISEFQADTALQHVGGHTPLQFAAYHGQEEAVLALINEFGCDTNVRDCSGNTLLHTVCERCESGDLNLTKTLIQDCNADVNAQNDALYTPLHLAAQAGKEDIAIALINEFSCSTSVKGWFGRTLLHSACQGGCLNLVRTLIRDHNADVNARDNRNNTPLHLAAQAGKEDVAIALINEFSCSMSVKGWCGRTLLHSACNGGCLNLVRTLIRDHNADVNARDDDNTTPLHLAAQAGKEDVAIALINEFSCSMSVKGRFGRTLLHSACQGGCLNLARTLIRDHNTDVNARDDLNYTPFHLAAQAGKKDIAIALINEFSCSMSVKGRFGRTLLHSACQGGCLNLARTLIRDHNTDVNARDDFNYTPFHLAAQAGKEDVAIALINEFSCSMSVKGWCGRTLLHSACNGGCLNLVRTLIRDHNADVNARDNDNTTPLHLAAQAGKEDVAIALINEFSCSMSVKGRFGRTLLHSACQGGCLNLARTLIRDHNTDVNARDDLNYTPFHLAAQAGKKDIAIALINEFSCSTSVKSCFGRTLLHSACQGGCLNLVRTLIRDHNADVNARDDDNNTSLHLAAQAGKEDIAIALINEFNCSTSVKGDSSRILLHSACQGRCLNLVRTLIRDHEADVNARDDHNNTPLHLAASFGKETVPLALINEFGCDKNARDNKGNNCLHTACVRGNPSSAKALSRHISPLTTNNDGDTPLHLASANIHGRYCVEELLLLDAPIMLRNAAGKTARDVASYHVKPLLDAYITANQGKIYTHYDKILQHARNIYFNAERITRIFVIGNCGAGKSTFVETMKREGFFESFYTVSESSVPPHTAGIVPSIYTSKLYGRVLFYDFAGDPEYYSSHAAILENLASSTKGDNIFILVVDLREDILKVRNIMDYWVSFIEHQKFFITKKNLLIIGSHSDLLTNARVDEKKEVFQKFCERNTLSTWHNKIAYFTLNCCIPRSQQLHKIKGRIVDLTKDSPCYKLSNEASVLLGLLEMDFSNVTACSAQTILSHIEDTGVSLPKNIASLMPILEELHDLGLLFVIGIDIQHVILNMSQLTHEVHQLLFSKEAKRNFTEGENPVSSLNVGILPQSVLDSLLPQYITKECLVKLQYCQEISTHDIGVFPSLTQPDSSDQSYLFFPALCTASKDDVSRDTPPSLSYSIGWLARCASTSCDYFPPRFLHVLLLRLVFRFTLAVPAQHHPSTSASPDHSHLKRRCTMWNCGVHWSMEEGVECMLELVNGNKGVVVITRSEEDAKVNCISVFHDVIGCVMEAKAKFCHSIRPQFFLLNPSQSIDYLHEDNLFAMNDVERVLATHNKREVLSFTGKSKLKRERIALLCKFTLWNSLFSLDFRSVVHYLEDVIHDLYKLFIYLGLPKSRLDTIEANFPNNVDRRRAELVGVWISSSSPDPPCWWQLVQALKEIKYGRLAQDIETKHSECSYTIQYITQGLTQYDIPGVPIQLQRTLLDPEKQSLRPDEQFLEVLAGVVRSECPSLASILSLTSIEIEEVQQNRNQLSQLELSLQILNKWATREEATYGQLCHKLKTIALF